MLLRHPVADPSMCLADYESYVQTQNAMSELYRNDKTEWNRKSLRNIAAAGYFAADRSIREYADRIWNLKRIEK